MEFDNYKFIYFNILLFIFVLTNNLFWFIIIVICKSQHYMNLESDTEYEFEHIVSSFDEQIENEYLEYDIDDDELYLGITEEYYLNYNCRFFFDSFGGYHLLDFMDFIDFKIYEFNDIRNYKYIYKNIKFNDKNIDLESDYMEYYFYEDYYKDYNNLYLIKNLNKDIYNIINNIEDINLINEKQRL
jgi:hypothetical protein